LTRMIIQNQKGLDQLNEFVELFENDSKAEMADIRTRLDALKQAVRMRCEGVLFGEGDGDSPSSG